MEDEAKEFQTLLEEKRHKELIDILKKILVNLNGKTTSTNNEGVEKLLDVIASKQNDTSIPKSITAIGNAIIKKIDEIKIAQTTPIKIKEEWEFIVHRNNNGFITSITAK